MTHVGPWSAVIASSDHRAAVDNHSKHLAGTADARFRRSQASSMLSLGEPSGTADSGAGRSSAGSFLAGFSSFSRCFSGRLRTELDRSRTKAVSEDGKNTLLVATPAACRQAQLRRARWPACGPFGLVASPWRGS